MDYQHPVLDKSNPIILEITKKNLSESTMFELKEQFLPFFELANTWKQEAESIVITDVNDKEGMKKAYNLRQEIKKSRVNMDKIRKSLKEEHLRRGQAIDTVSNIVKSIMEPLEEELEKKEKFALIQKQEEIAKLKSERTELLKPFNLMPEFLEVMKLGEMTQEQFNAFYIESESTHNAKIAEQKRLQDIADAEKKQAEKDRQENEKLKAENAELKAKQDAIDLEKKQAEEKQKADDLAKLQLKQDEAYKKSLADNGCTEENQFNFTTKKIGEKVLLYRLVGEYTPLPF